jgi:hypothetical protein
VIASVGFWLAGVLGLVAGGPVVGWLIAIAGAAILISLLKAVGVYS